MNDSCDSHCFPNDIPRICAGESSEFLILNLRKTTNAVINTDCI